MVVGTKSEGGFVRRSREGRAQTRLSSPISFLPEASPVLSTLAFRRSSTGSSSVVFGSVSALTAGKDGWAGTKGRGQFGGEGVEPRSNASSLFRKDQVLERSISFLIPSFRSENLVAHDLQKKESQKKVTPREHNQSDRRVEEASLATERDLQRSGREERKSKEERRVKRKLSWHE